MTNVLDLRQLLLNAAEELGLNLTERQITALAQRTVLNARILAPAPPRVPRRRLETLFALALGESVEETAVRLCVAPDTVKTHRRLLYAELGARSGAHAVAIGMSRDLFDVRISTDVTWAQAMPMLTPGGGR